MNKTCCSNKKGGAHGKTRHIIRSAEDYVEAGRDTLGGCLPPAVWHPLSVFHGVAAHGDGQRIQYEVIFSDEKVNASSTKSTNPGKGTTESGKQSTGSGR